MNPLRWPPVLWIAALLVAPPGAWAQRAPMGQREPHVGYVYPAGGQQGSEFEVTIGGQFLDGATRAIVSGDGAETSVLKHKKPLSPKELNEIREILQKAREQLDQSRQGGETRPGPGGFAAIMRMAEEMGVDAEKLAAFQEFRRARMDPKVQQNPQLAETVILSVRLAPDAQAGRRELRLLTGFGLSNPLRFQVGQLPEYCEHEPNDETPDAGLDDPLPVVFNGQIMPGDVDRLAFRARKGQRLVITVQARELMPYLADAVPGWFQATLAIYDAEGREVAYADDYRFHPDPVLYCVIPKTGRYALEIKDAIYRGREDFVYRVTVGEVPFVKSVFPLGGRSGAETTVELLGWNLPTDRLTVSATDEGRGIHPISVGTGRRLSNEVPLAVDTLPEQMEQEPNDQPDSAQRIEPPLVVNGRIGQSGDTDVFCFRGRAGGRVVVDVVARRLGSPLDSVLVLSDANGRQLAECDDVDNQADGLTTHHADARLAVTLPRDGDYFLRLGDAQHQGGAESGYRLRISPRRPDFELRVVPSTVNAPAGATVPITVYALRRDEFADDIALSLRDPPSGFSLSGGWVPAHLDTIQLTLSVPPEPQEEPVRLHLEGRAIIGSREVCRQAVPADDMMQAFIYRHLVPAHDWIVATTSRGRRRPLRLVGQQPVRLPAGGTARVEVAGPRRLPIDQLHLTVSQPPEGIAIADVLPSRQGLTILLRADAKQVKPGLKGNVLIDVSIDRIVQGRDANQGSQKRRVPLGALPAIPFEIVGSGT